MTSKPLDHIDFVFTVRTWPERHSPDIQMWLETRLVVNGVVVPQPVNLATWLAMKRLRIGCLKAHSCTCHTPLCLVHSHDIVFQRTDETVLLRADVSTQNIVWPKARLTLCAKAFDESLERLEQAVLRRFPQGVSPQIQNCDGEPTRVTVFEDETVRTPKIRLKPLREWNRRVQTTLFDALADEEFHLRCDRHIPVSNIHPLRFLLSAGGPSVPMEFGKGVRFLLRSLGHWPVPLQSPWFSDLLTLLGQMDEHPNLQDLNIHLKTLLGRPQKDKDIVVLDNQNRPSLSYPS